MTMSEHLMQWPVLVFAVMMFFFIVVIFFCWVTDHGNE